MKGWMRRDTHSPWYSWLCFVFCVFAHVYMLIYHVCCIYVPVSVCLLYIFTWHACTVLLLWQGSPNAVLPLELGQELTLCGLDAFNQVERGVVAPILTLSAWFDEVFDIFTSKLLYRYMYIMNHCWLISRFIAIWWSIWDLYSRSRSTRTCTLNYQYEVYKYISQA